MTCVTRTKRRQLRVPKRLDRLADRFFHRFFGRLPPRKPSEPRQQQARRQHAGDETGHVNDAAAIRRRRHECAAHSGQFGEHVRRDAAVDHGQRIVAHVKHHAGRMLPLWTAR